MSSPFKTPQDFLEAKGPIYSFSGNPAIIGLLIILSVGILIWFIYAAYTIKNDKPEAKNPVVVGILIALSAFSLAESVYKPHIEKDNRTITHKEVGNERVGRAKRGHEGYIPAVLGMIASGSTLQRQYRKSRRRLRNGNLILGNISQQIQKGLSLRGRSTRTTGANQSKRRSF